jgi:hypothetical protein
MHPNADASRTSMVFLVKGHFGWPFPKKNSYFYCPQVEAFMTNKVMHMCFHLVHVYSIQAHTFGQNI